MGSIFVVELEGVGAFAAAWSYRSAMRHVPPSNSSKYHVHEIPLEPLYAFLNEAMTWARENTPAGKKPVEVPNINDALDWAVSEVGEAVAARLHRLDKYVRNHPEKHLDDSVDYEIGQAIMMLSLASARDPMETIRKQLQKWHWRDDEPSQ